MTSQLHGGQLLVNGKPSLLLGGELHNSSGSTGRLMASRWKGIVDAGCDTLLAAVPWEQFEPEEGRYNTAVVDHLLEGAKAHELQLVLLWFGSWKNGVSTYVPPWVKRDPERFGVQQLSGVRSAVLSPFVEANVEADATAFAQFMSHVHQNDLDGRVVMVQIENEVGSLGDSRDRSPAAEKAWLSPVPDTLICHLRDEQCGGVPELLVEVNSAVGAGANWADVFGESEATDELFMAWHLATYVDRVAQRGRAQHDIPLYVNAWLNASSGDAEGLLSGGTRPGTYPSGGPLPHVATAWHAGAPSIDFLAPDIYASDPGRWLAAYRRTTPTVFVPELHRSPKGLGTVALAIGSFGAIGTSPFGIDELLEHERDGLRDLYGQIRAVTDDILDAQAVGTIQGFVVQQGQDTQFELGQYRFSVSTDRNFCEVPGFPEQGHGIVLALSPDEFLTLGRGFALRVETVDGRPTTLHSVHELALDEPTGRARDLPLLRWLNGDETLSGCMIRVTGEVISPFPGDLPASPSITGVVRFSVLDAPT